MTRRVGIALVTIAVAVTAATAVIVTRALADTRYDATLDGYRVDAATRLTVFATIGADDSIWEMHIEETDSEVRVRVSARRNLPLGSFGSAALRYLELPFTLSRPIGNRAVVDVRGVPVRRFGFRLPLDIRRRGDANLPVVAAAQWSLNTGCCRIRA